MDTHPKFVKLSQCSWCALLLPPVIQLVQSPHASSLHSTRVILARTTYTADDVACASSTRLTFTRPAWFWRALPLPPMLQLVHSLHASSSDSIRALLTRHTCATDATAYAVFQRLGPLLGPGSLAGTNCPADATAYALSERFGPLLDPGSLAGMNCHAGATACAVSERFGPLLDTGSLEGTNCPVDATACVIFERLRP